MPDLRFLHTRIRVGDLDRTIAWYEENRAWWKPVLSGGERALSS